MRLIEKNNGEPEEKMELENRYRKKETKQKLV